MSKLAGAGALALVVGVTSQPAWACRAYSPPEERIALGYRVKAISTVALVRIDEADYIGPPVGDAHPWRASATVERMIGGDAVGQATQFVQGLGSAACDDGYAPPPPGTRWIVYYSRHDKGAPRVWQAYPLAVAKAADKRFGPKMP